MNDVYLEYVKLILYEDQEDYNKSWGEVHYKYIYGDDQVYRTYRDKLSLSEYERCLKAFKNQEGTNYLPYEKHQILDSKTKKPLNMPYYLKEATSFEKMGDYVRRGVKTTTNVLKKGTGNVRGKNKDVFVAKRINGKRAAIKLTSIAATVVLLSSLGNFVLKRQRMYFSNMIYITKMSDSRNKLDNDIKLNFAEFEKIMNNITQKNYDDISREDLLFVSDYIYKLSKASNDSIGNGNFYEYNYISSLDKESFDYKFFSTYGIDYSYILIGNSYKKQYAYEYCARACNLLYYTIGALSTNPSRMMPTLDAITNFYQMSPLSRLVFLNQLKGYLEVNDFYYDYSDAPYWWNNLLNNGESTIEKMRNKAKISILAKIDELIKANINSLENEVNNKKENKTI